jgi:ankyrin repeat protein
MKFLKNGEDVEGPIQSVDIFLKHVPNFANLQDYNGNTCLHFIFDADFNHYFYGIATRLLKHGADLSLTTIEEGDTPLHCVARSWKWEFISLFPELRNPNPKLLNMKNKKGMTPIMEAIEYNHTCFEWIRKDSQFNFLLCFF